MRCPYSWFNVACQDRGTHCPRKLVLNLAQYVQSMYYSGSPRALIIISMRIRLEFRRENLNGLLDKYSMRQQKNTVPRRPRVR